VPVHISLLPSSSFASHPSAHAHLHHTSLHTIIRISLLSSSTPASSSFTHACQHLTHHLSASTSAPPLMLISTSLLRSPSPLFTPPSASSSFAHTQRHLTHPSILIRVSVHPHHHLTSPLILIRISLLHSSFSVTLRLSLLCSSSSTSHYPTHPHPFLTAPLIRLRISLLHSRPSLVVLVPPLCCSRCFLQCQPPPMITVQLATSTSFELVCWSLLSLTLVSPGSCCYLLASNRFALGGSNISRYSVQCHGGSIVTLESLCVVSHSFQSSSATVALF
jgi:hypothetical protein